MAKRCVFIGAVFALCMLAAGAATAAEPIVYYPFDEAGPTVVDQSGNGHDGTITGAVTLEDEGYLDKCYSFSGQNAYIKLVRPIQDSFTIAAWIKTSTNGATGTQAYQGNGIFWSDVAGTANDFVAAVLGTKFSFFVGNPDTSVNSNGDIVTSEWVHIAAVRDISARTISVYINGKLDNSVSHTNTASLTANSDFVIGGNTLDGRYYTGLMDEVRIYDVALNANEVRRDMTGGQFPALDPVPADGASDVAQDAMLAWTAGEFAATHDVYLGISMEDVGAATSTDSRGVLVSSDQMDASYDPEGLFDFGQTYYWRVDEVNAAPDFTVFKGKIWSFTAEPYGYPITGIKVTASSSAKNMGPEKTIDNSGLTNGLHGTVSTDQWMTSAGMPAWLQYDFNEPYPLYAMKVWNANQSFESAIGFGAKDVKVEYSLDGDTWTQLEGVPQFAQGASTDQYAANTTVEFGGVVARYVKLTITSNWGGVPQTGLSEVQFLYIPLQAFRPQPQADANSVSVASELDWRPGRGAKSHVVYLGTDANAVADGLVAGQTMADHGYAPALDLETTYYWKVDEVGDAGTVAGDVWSFTTEDYVVVDDMESYTDDEGTRIFDTWVDGLTNQDNGSTVGYLDVPYAEKTTVHSGNQSMPFSYDNVAWASSEATWTFASAQDWSGHGITSLVLYFRGQIDNSPGPLYMKINGKRVSFDNDATATTVPVWKQWTIPLADLGINLKSVKTLTIGVGGSGKGVILIDDIRLYAVAPEVAAPVDPAKTGLVALYTMDGNVQDTSGKNYNGTVNGSAGYDTGYSGQALVFNGSNVYVDLPIGSLIPTLTSTTVATHVRFDGGTGAWQRIFDFGSGSGTAPYMFLCPRENANGNIRFAIRTATVAENMVVSSGPMTVGWHHVAVTIDSQAMTLNLYLDGEPVGTAATTLLPKDLGVTTQNWLGRSQYATDAYFLGLLDDFRIYNRVLSDGELRYLAGDR